MKKRIILTEGKISEIVNTCIKKAIKESMGYNEMNSAIDDIGSQLEPLYKKLVELNFEYGDWLDENLNSANKNSFGYNFAVAFRNVLKGMETIDDIYNH